MHLIKLKVKLKSNNNSDLADAKDKYDKVVFFRYSLSHFRFIVGGLELIIVEPCKIRLKGL